MLGFVISLHTEPSDESIEDLTTEVDAYDRTELTNWIGIPGIDPRQLIELWVQFCYDARPIDLYDLSDREILDRISWVWCFCAHRSPASIRVTFSNFHQGSSSVVS
jgi:hypothetical protein